MSFETYIIEGKAGRDAEMRYTPSGTAVTSFSVAVDNEYTTSIGEKVKEVKWIRVSAWGKLAEICNQYVKKGTAVLVEGRLKGDDKGNPRTYQNNFGETVASFEMTASTVRLLGGRKESEKPATQPETEFPF